MSEDRLEKALEAMRSEHVSAEQMAGAKDRVWQELANPALTACAEFQPVLGDYLGGRLVENRRLLTEDHLSRCASCRARLAVLKGEGKVVAMPARRPFWQPRWRAWAAAAALAIAALYLVRDRIDVLLTPGGPRATVASVRGDLHRVAGGALQAGAGMSQDEVVRTGPASRAVLRLADGSLVDVNERTELFVRSAWSGQTIHLQRGDIIVQAARQPRGHLRVQTRDSIASVKGTVFAVSSGIAGSVVSVVEGSVAVTQPGSDVLLQPGEQAASNPALARPVREAIAWSPDSETYAALLASFSKIEKGMARAPQPTLRTQARLLASLPPNPAVYGAVPNLGGTIRQAMALVEEQSADNPTFRTWWNSNNGQELKQLIDRIQALTPLLGDEIVFVLCSGAPGGKGETPMVAAEVLPGKQGELVNALEALRAQAGAEPLPYRLTGSLLVISDSQADLQWVLDNMGQGASSPFATAIAARYQRGAGWLLGMNMENITTSMAGSDADLLGARQMKHLFLEQRQVQGFEENEVTLSFRGPRMGMASWLADSGSGGAAEYISSGALFSAYITTREPRQLLDEILAQLARTNLSSGGPFAEIEARLGAGFVGNLAAAFGTESAFALEGVSTNGPVWILAALVNNASTIDSSVRRLVDVFNAELSAENQARRISLSQETADGRVWNTLKVGQFPMAVVWTYDRGYMVAASDRAAATRAIAARSGGSVLVWSEEFRRQLPSSAGLHPAGFAWLNTRGVLEGFSSLTANPTLRKLISERDPILVVFDGTAEQIHSASRTRLTGLIMDAMLLQNLSRAGRIQAAAPARQAGVGKR